MSVVITIIVISLIIGFFNQDDDFLENYHRDEFLYDDFY